MEFLKTHYEKLLLSLALVALMGVTLFLWYQTNRIKKLDEVRRERGQAVKPINTNEFDAVVAHAESPPRWVREKRLFTPPPLMWITDPRSGLLALASPGDVPQVAQSELTDLDWLKRYKLKNEPGVAQQDPDDDGFNNKTEYDYKTDPTDPKSFPALKDYLIYDKPVTKEFQLRFKAWSEVSKGEMVFQVNVRALDYTYFNRLGEQIGDSRKKEPYKIEKFEPAHETYFDASLNAERQRDVSRLTLKRLDDGTDVVLTVGQIAIEKSLGAQLRNKLDGSEWQRQEVVKGAEFRVQGKTYKVVDIRTDAVIILDTLAQQEYTLAVNSP